jgi:hypothetical protein
MTPNYTSPLLLCVIWRSTESEYLFIITNRCLYACFDLLTFCVLLCSKKAINIDNCTVSIEQIGKSLKPDGWVEAYVINAFCRKLFRDNHPSKSQKHFFFHTSAVRCCISFFGSIFCFCVLLFLLHLCFYIIFVSYRNISLRSGKQIVLG